MGGDGREELCLNNVCEVSFYWRSLSPFHSLVLKKGNK